MTDPFPQHRLSLARIAATARAWAAERGAWFVEDGFEPHISEGAGSIAVELLARGDAFDAVVVPLGDGPGHRARRRSCDPAIAPASVTPRRGGS
jgi:hypothetical protein